MDWQETAEVEALINNILAYKVRFGTHAATPSTSLNTNDLYIESDTKDIYRWTGSAWAKIYDNIT